MSNELEQVLDKYFHDERILYFHPGDAIAADHYLRWEYFRNERRKILISIGSNDGEIQLKIFENSELLEQFIRLIIYN